MNFSTNVHSELSIFIRGNIPSAHAYGVFISQLIRNARACRNKNDCLFCARLLTIRHSGSNHYRSHELVHRYCVILFLSSFNYPILDFLWATRRMFLKEERTLTRPVHLVHAPRFWLEYQLLFMYYLSYFMFFVVSDLLVSSLSWITFFCFPLEVCFPWLLFHSQKQLLDELLISWFQNIDDDKKICVENKH